MTFLTIGLDGAILLRGGRNPVDAMGPPGLTAFVFTFVLCFVARLTFWDKASIAWQSAARTFISVAFIATVLLTACALALFAFGMNGLRPAAGYDTSLPITFTLLAALCQIASVTWLLRYRRE